MLHSLGIPLVATCLPELGDIKDINISPNNAFAFAHLGTEIKMRDSPHSCVTFSRLLFVRRPMAFPFSLSALYDVRPSYLHINNFTKQTASSHVTGNHITHGSTVAITSAFSKEEIAVQRAQHLALPGEHKREAIGILLQKIPILGRIIAHLTGECLAFPIPLETSFVRGCESQ
jgi:hypothetical protein